MARIELPIRSFVESFVKRAFPERDFSRGSGINDLVVKAFSVLMQPLRHELDVVKVNQSLMNYKYMREADLNALAANWGKFRQTGSRVEGNVRLYFNEAAGYQLSFLEFVDDAGSTYQLTSPLIIETADLLKNRRPDGTFSYDVLVRSAGVGDRYVVPAGSIRTVRGGPPALFACENVNDFQVTSPNESNLDVVNSMYRSIGLRNLVSRSSIRAPLMDEFSNLLDLFIAGSDHEKMFRDLITVDVDGQPVELHLGGTVDVWCNTNSVSQREVTISYLPSTKRIAIVSQAQAEAGELAYSFSRGLVSAEGMFISPDDTEVALDESFSVVFSQDGIPYATIVTADAVDHRWPLASKDLTGGSDLVVLPARGQAAGVKGVRVVDPIGPNLGRTQVTEGDMISTSLYGRRRITRKSARVLELSPVEEIENVVHAALTHAAGSRLITSVGIHNVADLNARVRINTGAAAGLYSVLALTTDTLHIGRIVAAGVLHHVSTNLSQQTWKVTGPQSAPATVLIAASPVVDEIVQNVSVTEIYLDTGFDISALRAGDTVTLAGVAAGVNGTYTIESTDSAGARPVITIAGLLPAVAAPAPGTISASRPAQYHPASLPPTVDATHWVYTGAGGAHDTDAAKWAQVVSVTWGLNELIVVVNGNPIASPTQCLFVGGLSGQLTTVDDLILESDAVSTLAPSSVLPDSTVVTYYLNNLVEDLEPGSTRLSALGIGELAQPGDLVVFTGSFSLTEAEITKTGGDGSKVTAFIGGVVSLDEIVLATPFTFAIPANSSYTITRNASVATGTVAAGVSAATKTIQIATLPLGIGDGTGMAIMSDSVAKSGLLISAISVHLEHARIQFQGSPTLDIYISDRLAILDAVNPAYDGSYRIISIDQASFSIVIEADFSGDGPFSGPGTLTASVSRLAINQISTSTAGAQRTLTFAPPKKVYTLEMSPEMYTAVTEADIGRVVEQVAGNVTYRGTLYAFDNVTRVWEIEPVILGVDVFTDAVASFGTIPGFASCTPAGSESVITFPPGTDMAAMQLDDRFAISGGTAIDGIYFATFVDPVAKLIRVAGALTPIAGPGPHGTVQVTRTRFLRAFGSSLRAYPIVGGINTNANVGFTRGYIVPNVPADLGKLVRQGTNTALLDGVNVGAGVYEWVIRPISDDDLFSSLSDPVYISSSSDGPAPADPQGMLLKPASKPSFSLSTVTLVMSDTPTMLAGAPLVFLPRFTRNGAMIEEGAARTNIHATSALVDFLAAGVTPEQHQLMVVSGDGIGLYDITEVEQYRLGLPVSPTPTFVKIANAPGPQTLTVPVSGLNLTAAPTIVSAGSGIGLWGGSGRVLHIAGGGREYYLPLAAPPSIDSVQPAYGVPVTLSSTIRWTWEILEGFSTDYWIVPKAALSSYRIYRPPRDLGASLVVGTKGSTGVGSTRFTDSSVNFASVLGGVGTGGELLLYIDSGSAANIEPYIIEGLVSESQLELDADPFTASSVDVQYRIVYRPAVTKHEGWHSGTIVSANQIKLRLPANSDLRRHYTAYQAVVLIEPDSYGSPVAAWTVPRLTGEFDPATQILTLDLNAAESNPDWVAASGFPASRIAELVRVHLRVTDRNIVASADGSVINTYNYYVNREFFSLPVVKIQAVQLLDRDTLTPVRELPYSMVVKSKGLRYSTDETNEIEISDEDAKFQPIRVRYIADASIEAINTYLNNQDTRVLGQSAMAKRMETISVDVSVRVVSQKTSSSVATAIASYINSLRSNRRLTKVELVKFIFDEGLASYVELDTMTMDVTYYQVTGEVTVASNVSEYFGSDIACYLSGTISVAKITQGT